MSQDGSVERPLYHKVYEDRDTATKTYMIVCDEGWRESIICNNMYEYVADWLLSIIQFKPYAKESKGGI